MKPKHFPCKNMLLPCVFLLIIVFSGCHQNPRSGDEAGGMDGLWRCTPETALDLGEVILEAVVYISGSTGSHPDVRACFINNGEFVDYWHLDSITFLHDERTLILHDEDGSIYKGILERERTMIKGTVFSEKEGKLIPEDALDLVPAPGLDPLRLFFPRMGPSGRDLSYNYRVPDPGRSMPTASLWDHGGDSAGFRDLMEEIIRQEYGRLESFLLLKEGKLLVEEYFYNHGPDTLHNIHSCTKSIVSMLTGIALDEAGNSDMKKPIISFFPELEPRDPLYKKITLEQVLTMSAGIEEGNAHEHVAYEGLADQILSRPLHAVPGQTFDYNSESPYLLGALIHRLSGMPVEDFAREKLFAPLGIHQWYWPAQQGVVHFHSNLHMLPRDMAKIGLLVLQEGKWEGRQVVPAKWLRTSTGPHIRESQHFHYGYQWWHRSAQDQAWWERSYTADHPEHPMTMALGHGGQFIFVVRDMDLVVVTTASDYNESGNMGFSKIPMVIEGVIPLFHTEKILE